MEQYMYGEGFTIVESAMLRYTSSSFYLQQGAQNANTNNTNVVIPITILSTIP